MRGSSPSLEGLIVLLFGNSLVWTAVISRSCGCRLRCAELERAQSLWTHAWDLWPDQDNTWSQGNRWSGWVCSRTRWWRSRRETCGGSYGSLHLRNQTRRWWLVKMEMNHQSTIYANENYKKLCFSIKGVMNWEIKIPLIFWHIRGHCSIKASCKFQNSKLSCYSKNSLYWRQSAKATACGMCHSVM